MSVSTLNPTPTPRNRVFGRPDQYLDVNNTPRSSGTKFLASSPNPPPKVDNQTTEFKAAFDLKVAKGEARYILSTRKRLDYLHHLKNPTAPPRGETLKQKAADSNTKSTCFESYEL